MKLTELVQTHGFRPSDMAEIKDAKLYERWVNDLMSELLCVQKIGNVFRVDRMVIAVANNFIQPMGSPVNKLVPKDELEAYLKITLMA